MNIKIFAFLFLSTVFFSCSEDMGDRVNGYWQLRDISYPEGTVAHYDSIFYGFQHERLFSFTSLAGTNPSHLSYGYVYFPSDSEMQIKMDTLGFSNGYLINVSSDFLERSTWSTYENTFSIVSITGKEMELLDSEGKVYLFRKYE